MWAHLPFFGTRPKIKRSIWYFFLFYHPPTLQKGFETGLRTKRSNVLRLMSQLAYTLWAMKSHLSICKGRCLIIDILKLLQVLLKCILIQKSHVKHKSLESWPVINLFAKMPPTGEVLFIHPKCKLETECIMGNVYTSMNMKTKWHWWIYAKWNPSEFVNTLTPSEP